MPGPISDSYDGPQDVPRCEECGRTLDRPSFYDPCSAGHQPPSAAQTLVEQIESAIHSRKGLGWRHLDRELVDEIRDELTELVQRFLDEQGRP